jgi:hypothetical protein
MIGKNVTVDTICLSIDRISAWISASGLHGCALSRLMLNNQRLRIVVNRNPLFDGGLSGLLHYIDIKNPSLEWGSSVFRYDRYNKLRHRSCEQPRYASR